jgi:broad specificity phosphatase PhoE
MAPKIHLVRHAQGLHNLCAENTKIRDPDLTPLGKQQCAELQQKFPHHHGVDLIVASPIRRTLYTALLSFEDDIKTKQLTIIALPELQETSDLPCDTGSSLSHLANEFASSRIDFSHVQPGWNVKTGKWGPDKEAINKRAQEAREWLAKRPEKEIVVVTHGSYRSFDGSALIADIVVSCVLSLLPLPMPFRCFTAFFSC